MEQQQLAGRLRVHEFMILTTGGIPIFHYSPTETRKLDEVLSGFLTAITSFASEFGERSGPPATRSQRHAALAQWAGHG